MNRIFFFLSFFFVVHKGLCQNEGQEMVDSLMKIIPNEKSDTIKAKIYNKLGNYYVQVNLDSAMSYAIKGLQLTTQMKWDKGISVFHTLFGNIYIRKGDLDAALKEHQTALSYSLKIKDTINIGIAFNNLGTIANAKSDFVNAAKYYTHTLDIGKLQKNFRNIGVACENLSLVYQYQEDYEKQLEYARQSLAAYETIHNESAFSNPLGLIGNAFMNVKKYDSAYFYYIKAIHIAEETNDELKKGALYNYLSQYYSEKKKYSVAIQTALKAKKIFDRIGPSFEDAITNKGLLGYYYLQMAQQSAKDKSAGLLKTAHEYLDEAVQQSKEAGNVNVQTEFQKSLAEVNAMMTDYRNAYFNYKAYSEISDSIFSQENKNKLAAIASEKEMEKKQLEIEKQKMNVREQKKKEWLLLMGLSLVAVLGLLFYRVSVVRKQKNKELKQLNAELDEANKVKVKFFGIISHDLRNPIANLVNFLNLRKIAPETLSKEEAEEKENKIRTAAESLLNTMENMLLWSKSQMTTFHAENNPVKVSRLFFYLQQIFGDNKNLSLSFTDNQQMEINSDENFLKTILHNLTANAVAVLANKKDGQIEWKAWQSNNKSFLSIHDNGPGINAGKLNALFDENAGSGSAHGFGLHIIRDMAKAIHCDISVNSDVSTGTEFVLTLKKPDC